MTAQGVGRRLKAAAPPAESTLQSDSLAICQICLDNQVWTASQLGLHLASCHSLTVSSYSAQFLVKQKGKRGRTPFLLPIGTTKKPPPAKIQQNAVKDNSNPISCRTTGMSSQEVRVLSDDPREMCVCQCGYCQEQLPHHKLLSHIRKHHPAEDKGTAAGEEAGQSHSFVKLTYYRCKLCQEEMIFSLIEIQMHIQRNHRLSMAEYKAALANLPDNTVKKPKRRGRKPRLKVEDADKGKNPPSPKLKRGKLPKIKDQPDSLPRKRTKSVDKNTKLKRQKVDAPLEKTVRKPKQLKAPPQTLNYVDSRPRKIKLSDFLGEADDTWLNGNQFRCQVCNVVSCSYIRLLFHVQKQHKAEAKFIERCISRTSFQHECGLCGEDVYHEKCALTKHIFGHKMSLEVYEKLYIAPSTGRDLIVDDLSFEQFCREQAASVNGSGGGGHGSLWPCGESDDTFCDTGQLDLYTEVVSPVTMACHDRPIGSVIMDRADPTFEAGNLAAVSGLAIRIREERYPQSTPGYFGVWRPAHPLSDHDYTSACPSNGGSGGRPQQWKPSAAVASNSLEVKGREAWQAKKRAVNFA